MARLSLTLADAVDHSFKFVEIDDEIRLKMMISFQAKIDYDSLTAICIKHKKSELFFTFLRNSSLRRKFRKAAVVAGFRESVKRD